MPRVAGMSKPRVVALLVRSRRQPRHRAPDAGDRAADGHRLGRGIHARPRRAAPGLVSRAARSCRVRSTTWRPLPPDGGAGSAATTHRPAPSCTARYAIASCCSIARSWRGSGRLRAGAARPSSVLCLARAGGDVLAPSWQDLPRARLGPILLFSLTAGAIFFFSATRWGYWPAALAAGSWVFQPNLFGHGHYAAYDGVLTSLWVLSIIVFAQAVLPESGLSGGIEFDGCRRWPSVWSSAAPRQPS